MRSGPSFLEGLAVGSPYVISTQLSTTAFNLLQTLSYLLLASYIFVLTDHIDVAYMRIMTSDPSHRSASIAAVVLSS